MGLERKEPFLEHFPSSLIAWHDEISTINAQGITKDQWVTDAYFLLNVNPPAWS